MDMDLSHTSSLMTIPFSNPSAVGLVIILTVAYM